jgi:hypothetical protein
MQQGTSAAACNYIPIYNPRPFDDGRVPDRQWFGLSSSRPALRGAVLRGGEFAIAAMTSDNRCMREACRLKSLDRSTSRDETYNY